MLTFQTAAPVDAGTAGETLSVRKTKASPPVSQLVRLLWGEDTAELQMSIGHIPHIVMYLSLKLDSASPQEEVRFCKCMTCSPLGVHSIHTLTHTTILKTSV